VGQVTLKSKISTIRQSPATSTFFVLDGLLNSDSRHTLLQLEKWLPTTTCIRTDPLSTYSAGGIPVLQLYFSDPTKWFQAVHLLLIFSRLDSQLDTTGPCILESSLQTTERAILNNRIGDCSLLERVIVDCRSLFVPHAIFALPSTFSPSHSPSPLDLSESDIEYFYRISRHLTKQPSSLPVTIAEIVDEVAMVHAAKHRHPTEPVGIGVCALFYLLAFDIYNKLN